MRYHSQLKPPQHHESLANIGLAPGSSEPSYGRSVFNLLETHGHGVLEQRRIEIEKPWSSLRDIISAAGKLAIGIEQVHQ